MTGNTRLDEVARLRLIIDTQRLVNASVTDSNELMRAVTCHAQQLTKADAAVVELLEGSSMVYRAVSGNASGLLGSEVAREADLSGLCMSAAQSLRCDDTDSDPRVDRLACERARVRSLVVVPLMHDDTPIGVLKVTAARPSRFGDRDVDVLEILASFIAAALANAATHERESYRALHDSLTGLPNRALLVDRLELALRKARLNGAGLAVFFIDLDGFRSVNETYGRSAGDELLRAAARELTAILRTGDTLARFGGDEFVLLCEQADEPVEYAVRNRIEAAMAKVRLPSDPDLRFTASVGHSWASGAVKSGVELLAAADASMYQDRMARRAEVSQKQA